jgi:hypothetical protein
MSSCAYFQHFHLMPCLDNIVSGIPNAISGPIIRQTRRRVCGYQEHGLSARGDRGA